MNPERFVLKLFLVLLMSVTLTGCGIFGELFGRAMKNSIESIPPLKLAPPDDVYEPIRTVRLERDVQEQILLDCKGNEMERKFKTTSAPITRTKIVSKNNIPIERGVFTNTVNGDVAGSALFNTDKQWVGVTLDDGLLGTGLRVARGDNLVKYSYETCERWLPDESCTNCRRCERWNVQEEGEVTLRVLARTRRDSFCVREAKCSVFGKFKGHKKCEAPTPSGEYLETDW